MWPGCSALGAELDARTSALILQLSHGTLSLGILRKRQAGLCGPRCSVHTNAAFPCFPPASAWNYSILALSFVAMILGLLLLGINVSRNR